MSKKRKSEVGRWIASIILLPFIIVAFIFLCFVERWEVRQLMRGGRKS